DVFLSRREDGTLEGFALVAMPSPEYAARLVATGLPPLLGRELRVAPRAARGQWNGRRGPKATPRLPAPPLVGDLPPQASQSEVELHIAAVAPVVRVGLPRNPDGSGKGVAFVALERADDAARVVAALDGSIFQGRRLRVSLARARGAA